jgi:hypothetical protein
VNIFESQEYDPFCKAEGSESSDESSNNSLLKGLGKTDSN